MRSVDLTSEEEAVVKRLNKKQILENRFGRAVFRGGPEVLDDTIRSLIAKRVITLEPETQVFGYYVLVDPL